MKEKSSCVKMAVSVFPERREKTPSNLCKMSVRKKLKENLGTTVIRGKVARTTARDLSEEKERAEVVSERGRCNLNQADNSSVDI